MAKSGLRLQVMGNRDGTDRFQIRDLLDLVMYDGHAKCVRTPSRIIVRRKLFKTNNPYLMFSTKSAMGNIVVYLNDRLVRGESIHMDSLIITSEHICKTCRGRNSSNVLSDKQNKQFDARHIMTAFLMGAVRVTGIL